MTSAMGRDSVPRSAGNGAPTDSGQLQQAATGLMDQAARTADAQASTRMTMAGDTLDGIARAINDAAERLREDQPEIANLTTTAGERLQEAATYLRDHSASDALDGAQQYARRQPAIVVGGGLIAGLLLGRLLRTGASVAQSTGQRQLGSGYAPSAATSYGYGDTSSEPFEADVVVTDVESIDDLGEITGESGTTSEAR